MSARWQISAGEISEWLPPFLFALAAVASAWVLSDARRRNFASYAVAAWTLAALLSPPVVLPLYLLARTFKQKPDAPPQSEEAQDVSDENDVAAEVEENDAANEADESDGDAAFAPAETSTGAQAQTSAAPPEKTRAAFWRTYAALVYALALLSLGAIYFYRDYRSLDAHLARAANARLVGQRSTTIREYRAALRLAPDAHTQKLLAVELAADGQLEEALAGFRAAEAGGEPDELLPFRVAATLDALGRQTEATNEYRKFLQSDLCRRSSPDARCAEARRRAE